MYLNKFWKKNVDNILVTSMAQRWLQSSLGNVDLLNKDPP